MQIRTRRIPRARYLARAAKEVSRAARQRLRWMDHYASQGRNAAFTCRYFGISRQTFYRWRRRYDPQDLSKLEDGSHRPHRCRRPTWTPGQVAQVLRLRLEYPRWGKDKLAVLLGREGCRVSTSMVGRILTHLKKRGRLVEPLPNGRTARRGLWSRPYAVRKPKDYRVERPGDLVQVDTLDVRPRPGVMLKQFTARDVVSRWDVMEARSRATALTAAEFLDTLEQRIPFPLRALQVDGGSEFAAVRRGESNRPASNVASICSSSRPARPNSTAMSSALNVPIPRSSMKSSPTPSTSLSSIVNSVPGSAPTTPSALTRLSATLLLISSCPVPIPFERTPCVTNLLDEYRGWRLKFG